MNRTMTYERNQTPENGDTSILHVLEDSKQ